MRQVGEWFQEGYKKVAEFISKDGTGRAIVGFNKEEIARSAAYNRVAHAANDIIKTMDPEAAKEVRSAIRNGENFTTGAFEDALNKIFDGDEAAQNAADKFLTMETRRRVIEDEIASGQTADVIGAYAEFLGRNDGKLGVANTLEGYFGDQKHGVKRIHGALGAAAGIGVANRLLNGGSLTRTNTGERDIAGIPFI